LTDDICKVEKDDPTVTLSANEQAKQDEAKKQSKTAFMLLSLSSLPSDETTFGAIQNAKTDDLPKGDAKTSWKTICEINHPISRTELHILEQKFNHCSLPDNNSSPDKWFSKLENIRSLLKLDHNYNISEDKLITIFLNNTPSRNYATVLTFLKMKLLTDGKLDLVESRWLLEQHGQDLSR
jgi:hypothetical protein